MKIQPNRRLVMIGDSITDTGRTQPVGEGLFEAIGRGYVSYVDGLLGAAYPGHAIRVTNMGIGGNTVRDLAARWERDVLALQPHWLSVMIGINDVWRQFDLPRQTELHVPPEEYEETLAVLLAQVRPKLEGLVVMTPFFIEPNREDAMRRQMDRYGAIAKRVGADNGAIVVDTQAAFDRVLEHMHPAALAWDRIHPNHIGHMVLARAFLDGIEFAWDDQS